MSDPSLDEMVARAVAEHDGRRHSETVRLCMQVLARAPRHFDALALLGAATIELGRYDIALKFIDAALAIRADVASLHVTRGVALRAAARIDDAMASGRRALELDPGSVDAREELAQCLLLRGELQAGLDLLGQCMRERAPATTDRGDRADGAPHWDGAPAPDKTLLLHADNRLGNTIQVVRYVPLVAKLVGRVILEVEPRLVRLLSSSRALAGVTVVARSADRAPPIGAEKYDLQSSLWGLISLFHTTLATIPADVPYLDAEPARIEQWRRRLDGTDRAGARLHIGVTWHGDPSNRVYLGRNFPLAAMAPIAALPGVRLISLQQLHGLAELASLPSGMVVESLADLDTGADAFVDTAALMASLDLVVSCDTSVTHLAGALGRKVWLAVKQVPEWRWMLDRDDSPWYPTVRIFRQRSLGGWPEVFSRMATELVRTDASRSPERRS